jgi:hypothetical protein
VDALHIGGRVLEMSAVRKCGPPKIFQRNTTILIPRERVL